MSQYGKYSGTGGGGGGSGSVTSVGLAAPASILTVSNSPVTSTGTLTLTLVTQAANTVWAGPTSGGAATPTFRTLVSGDVPAPTFPILAPQGGGPGAPAYAFSETSNDTGMYSSGDGNISFSTNGTLVLALSPTQSATFTGTVAATDFIYPVKAANTFLAGPTSGTNFPTFRLIALGDITAGALPFPMNAPNGSAGAPSYNFDVDSGMFGISDGVFGFSTNGTERLRFENNGDVVVAFGGSGTLIVNGNETLTGTLTAGGDGNFTGNISAANYPPVDTANTLAAFNPSGVLASLPGWTTAPQFGAYGLHSSQAYTIPADGTGGGYKIYSFETEFTAANDNTDQTLYSVAMDSHVDRAHGGQDVAVAIGLNVAASVEGAGTVGVHNAVGISHSLTGDSGGTTTNATSIALGSGVAAGYNIGTYQMFSGTFNADPTSTVGDAVGFSLGTSVATTATYQGLVFSQNGGTGTDSTLMAFNQVGDVGGVQRLIGLGAVGNVTGNFNGMTLAQSGNTGNFQGISVDQVSGNTGNAEGVRINFGPGTAANKTALSIVMNSGATSGSGRILEAGWGAGNYNNRIGINAGGGSGNITVDDTGFNTGCSSGTTATFTGFNSTAGGGTVTGNYQGLVIGGSATVGTARGVNINLSSFTSSNQKQGITIDDGALQVNSNYNTSILPPSPQFTNMNNLSGVYTVAAGFPATGSAVVFNNLASASEFDDNMGPDAFGGILGFTGVGFLNQTVVGSGKTVDMINGLAVGASVPTGSGGTVTNMSCVRVLGVLPFGGTFSVTNMYGVKVDSTLSALTPTNAWGVWVGDTNAHNWFAGTVKIGGGDTPDPGYSFHSVGDAQIATGGQILVDVTNATGVRLNDNVGGISVDVQSRYLQTAAGVIVMDWGSAQAISTSGVLTLDWNSGILNDTTTVRSLDWDRREMFDNAGAVVFKWQTGIGFFGTTPVAQQTSSGAQTAGAVYTATEQTMLQEAYNALRAYGLLS